MQSGLNTYQNSTFSGCLTFGKSDLNARRNFLDEIKGEGNSVNYKYRMHDPRIGRFFAVDPLAAKYSYNSPYAFSENVVISHVELEGLEKSVYLNVVANDGKKRGVSLTDSWSIQSYWAYVVLNQNNITWVGDSRQQYLGSWNGWNGSSDDLDGCRNGSAGSCDSHLKNNGILWLTLDAKTQKYKASYQYNQERPPKGYASWEELKEAGENIESGGAIMKYIGLGIAIIAPEIGLPLAETGAAIETSGELMQIGAGIGKNGVTTETVTDATFILAPKPLKEIVNANSPAKEIIVEAAVDATQDKVNQKRGSKKNR